MTRFDPNPCAAGLYGVRPAVEFVQIATLKRTFEHDVVQGRWQLRVAPSGRSSGPLADTAGPSESAAATQKRGPKLRMSQSNGA